MDQSIRESENALRAGQRRLEEEQRRREEERRRRGQIETTTQDSTLSECLEHCRGLHTPVAVVTDKSLSTQGSVSNPVL